MSLYGSQKLNIQQLISPVLMDQIASNFDKNGRIIVLPVCTVWCQSDHGNPLFLACENGKKDFTFRYNSSLAGPLWFWCFEMKSV